MSDMTMEDFDAKYQSNKKSPQTAAIRAMQPGEVIQLNHDGLAPCSGSPCSINSAVAAHRKTSPYHFRSIHLPNGDIVIACTAKEETRE